MKPVLIFLTAKDCGACKRFKKEWQSINKKIKNEVSEIKELELPSIQSDLPHDYPNEFKNMKTWFPMFILINPEDLKKSQDDPDIKTRFVVFNGDTSSGKLEMVERSKLMNMYEDNVIRNWIINSNCFRIIGLGNISL